MELKRSNAKEVAPEEKNIFEAISEHFDNPTVDVEICDGCTVSVKHRLSMSEMLAAIRMIADSCTDEENGIINHEVYDYATKLTICAMYCGIKAPVDSNIGYEAVVGRGRMYEKIRDHIDTWQELYIWEAAEKILESRENMYNSAAAKITIDMLGKMEGMYEMIEGMSKDFNSEESVDALNQLRTIIGK